VATLNSSKLQQPTSQRKGAKEAKKRKEQQRQEKSNSRRTEIFALAFPLRFFAFFPPLR
jgi:hypothetical protein